MLSGGVMLGAFFIATDYVTSPNTPQGRLVFGSGVGLLDYIIRTWAGYPEGIAFAILLWLWLRYKDSAPPLARQHLKQATFVSLYGGLLIVSLTAIFILVGGLYWEYTWVAVILYFTCIHSTLILLGMVALVKAMGGQAWRFPIIGPTLDGQP